MSEEFKIEIVNPDKSYLSKDDVTEVIVPAFEGEMGILKDHISIISFLKPGIMKIYRNNNEEKFYIDDGIVEFKDNKLSILTSSIIKLDQINKNFIDDSIQEAEKKDFSGLTISTVKSLLIMQHLFSFFQLFR